jgi:hypothetical protein
MQQLATLQSDFLFPVTAICEAITILKSKLNKLHDAERIVQKFHSGKFPLQAVERYPYPSNNAFQSVWLKSPTL